MGLGDGEDRKHSPCWFSEAPESEVLLSLAGNPNLLLHSYHGRARDAFIQNAAHLGK